MTKVTVTELRYIDEAANHDKFYRVFVVGDELVTQYGRAGTFGHFNRKAQVSAGDAEIAAVKAITSKITKGYVKVVTGDVEVPEDPSDSDLDAAVLHV